jgi:enterochelin esterase-like enzyme
VLKYIFVAGLILFYLTGCGAAALPIAEGRPSDIINTVSIAPTTTITHQAISTSTGTPTETARPASATPTNRRTPRPPTSTPTLTACMKAGGRVEVKEFTTVLLPNPMVYRIYLPPCYDEQTEQSYPVLYLIHGQTYSDTQWDRLGVPEIADRLIASGEVAPFIVVMPRDRVWSEPTEDHFGLAVEQSLIPWVDEHYRTLSDREHRAVGGLSRGGAWAVHLGFSHPELFSAVGIHSGFVFHSDVQQLHLWLKNMPEDLVPRIYMDIGASDPNLLQAAKWLEKLLTEFHLPHEWHMFSGEHDETYWQAHVEDYLRWYTREWRDFMTDDQPAW